MEQGCRVEEILTVTFTQAATDELRDRIHARLLRPARRFGTESAGGGDRERPEAGSGASSAPLRTSTGRRSTPFTGSASGSCASMPSRPAARFRRARPGPSALLREVAEDYWRRCSPTPRPRPSPGCSKHLPAQTGLLSFLPRVKAPVFRVRPQPAAVDFTALEAYRRTLETLRGLWAAQGDEALRLLADPGLHAGTYGSCEPGRAQDPRGQAP